MAKFGARSPNFDRAFEGVGRLQARAAAINRAEQDGSADPQRLNAAIICAERALLLPAGLPNRTWYKHAIYAPGEFTGYAAVTLPGVSEAIDAGDLETVQAELGALTKAITLAADQLQQQ
jgi:N-acetylated-alpha-linked acidic dipeptidase